MCSVDAGVVHRLANAMKNEQGVGPLVISLNPQSVQDVIDDCVVVGDAVGMPEQGRAAAAALSARLDAARALASGLVPVDGATPPRVAFLEWTDPLFPGGHWTPSIIAMAGGSHPLNPPDLPSGVARPSAEISPEDVVACDPDLIILVGSSFDGSA